MSKHDTPTDARTGYILIDAWRAEAELFRAAGKSTSAARLERMALRAEVALARHRLNTGTPAILF